MDYTISPLTAERWPALEDLFGQAGASNGCWCMYWRIGPGYRGRPRADNKRDLRQLAASGRPPGLLAFDGELTVGWCELAPRAELAWLTRAQYLQPPDDLPVRPLWRPTRWIPQCRVIPATCFPGVASVFARHGFQVILRRKPDRPVMRRRLSWSV